MQEFVAAIFRCLVPKWMFFTVAADVTIRDTVYDFRNYQYSLTSHFVPLPCVCYVRLIYIRYIRYIVSHGRHGHYLLIRGHVGTVLTVVFWSVWYLMHIWNGRVFRCFVLLFRDTKMDSETADLCIAKVAFSLLIISNGRFLRRRVPTCLADFPPSFKMQWVIFITHWLYFYFVC
jgi:hypothetical protein